MAMKINNTMKLQTSKQFTLAPRDGWRGFIQLVGTAIVTALSVL